MREQGDNGRPRKSALDSLRAGPAGASPDLYVLHLYTAGNNGRSLRAVDRVKRLLDAYLPGRYKLRVTDLYSHPSEAAAAQVLAAPTLVKELPAPLRQVVGDMADVAKILRVLGVRAPA